MNAGRIRPAAAADRARIEAIVDAAYRPYLQRMNRPPAPMVDDYAKRIADGQTEQATGEPVAIDAAHATLARGFFTRPAERGSTGAAPDP
jgi:hypothetical protein